MQIARLLHQAAESRKYADLRMMATQHFHKEQYIEELDANMAAGSLYWLRAKRLIMENKELIEQEIKELGPAANTMTDVSMIRTAQMVIDNELDLEAEKALTTTE